MATKPMANEINMVIRYELSTSDPDNTKVSAKVRGSNVYLGVPDVWADGKTITVPYRILDRPGEFASISVTVECSSPTGSNSDSKDLGRSYIVAIPSYSVSIEPTTIGKVGTIEVIVAGLDEIDDSYGSLEVEAYVNGRSYSLDHQGRGIFARMVDVDFRDQAGGSKDVKVQVYKYYAGVSALDWERKYVTTLGSKPSISGELPSTLHRGDSFTITVNEPDGDTLKATLHAFGKDYSLARGPNEITVPRNIDSGFLHLHVDAADVDGAESKSWDVEIANIPPHVSLSLDKNHVASGDPVQVTVTAWDDSSGLELKLIVEEIGYSELLEPNTTTSVTIPEDYHGSLTFLSKATDRDLASASDTATARAGFPPSISGEIPSSLHRDDTFVITVGGDEVSGSIEAFGGTIDVRGPGDYEVTVPTGVRAGTFTFVARVSSPYGSASKRWDAEILNEKPVIEVEAPSEARTGDTITIKVSWSDDADGSEVSLTIDGVSYSVPPSGLVRYTVPDDKAGKEVDVVARVVDIDGVAATDSVTLRISPVSPGSGQENESGSSNGSTGTSAAKDTVRNNADLASHTSDQEAELTIQNGSTGTHTTDAPEMDKRSKDNGKKEVENGFMDVVVTPENPYENDEVTIIAKVENASGSLWIVAPNGTTVEDLYVNGSSTITLTVDRAGIWLVKWAYRSTGRTIFDQMDLHVRKHPKTATSPDISTYKTMNVTKRPSAGLSEGSPSLISPYRMICMVVRPAGGEDNTLLPLLAIITTVGFLIAWIRVR